MSLRAGSVGVVVAAIVLAACSPPTPDRAGDRHDDVLGTVTTRPLRFAVIGDTGTGGPKQYAIARRMCARHDRRPFSFVVTAGDNVYPDGDPDLFGPRFFRPLRCLSRRGVEFRASLGNHDALTGGGFPEVREPRFGMPRRNYSFAASGVRFVVLNSNRLNMEFVRSRLRRYDGARWTVVVMHHPVYSPGPHGPTPGFRTKLVDLFVRRGVDLVIAGHDHLYSVSKRLRGIRYLVTGGAGAALYDCSERWFTAVCKERHHFVVVTAWDDRLGVTAVAPGGATIHRFSTSGIA